MPQDIDCGPLEDLFREEVFKVFLKREKITEERIELLRSWKHSGFRVFSERRIAQGERQELESLLQYMERAPVSLQRLSYLDISRNFRERAIPSLDDFRGRNEGIVGP